MWMSGTRNVRTRKPFFRLQRVHVNHLGNMETKKMCAMVLLEYRKQLDSRRSFDYEHEEERWDQMRNAALFSINLPIQIIKSGTEWQLMLDMDHQTFQRHFRITRTQFDQFVQKLRERGMSEVHPSGGPEKIPSLKKVLMLLWYLANQNSFRELSDKFNTSQGAAHNVIMEMLDLTCQLASSFITWPTNCEKQTNAGVFHRICGIEGIVGAIDGCHIKIQRPPVRGGDYLNRKSYYSILLQGIVNDQGKFIDIFTGAPGRVHDSRVLRVSPFFHTWRESLGQYKLLGDTAYISQNYPFIVTPKRDNGVLTLEDQRVNACVSRGRVIVEQAFGRLKCKWRRLRDIQNSQVDNIVKIIVACCALHNMCIGLAEEGCNEHPHGCPRQEDENHE